MDAGVLILECGFADDLVPSKLLQDLESVGFRTNMGIEGSGFAFLASTKAGGYYIGQLNLALCG